MKVKKWCFCTSKGKYIKIVGRNCSHFCIDQICHVCLATKIPKPGSGAQMREALAWESISLIPHSRYHTSAGQQWFKVTEMSWDDLRHSPSKILWRPLIVLGCHILAPPPKVERVLVNSLIAAPGRGWQRKLDWQGILLINVGKWSWFHVGFQSVDDLVSILCVGILEN